MKRSSERETVPRINAKFSLEFSHKYNLIEQKREANDVLYGIFFGPDECVDNYLPNLVGMVMDKYGSLFSEDGKYAIENVVYMDREAKQAFILMGLYAFSPFLSYFLYGTPTTPPPKLANREAFKYYVENVIGVTIEKMLNGLKMKDEDPLKVDLTKMVYHLRPEYVFTAGIYRDIDPVMRPEEHKNIGKSNNNNKQEKTFTCISLTI